MVERVISSQQRKKPTWDSRSLSAASFSPPPGPHCWPVSGGSGESELEAGTSGNGNKTIILIFYCNIFYCFERCLSKNKTPTLLLLIKMTPGPVCGPGRKVPQYEPRTFFQRILKLLLFFNQEKLTLYAGTALNIPLNDSLDCLNFFFLLSLTLLHRENRWSGAFCKIKKINTTTT